jgi:hypothetical protein
MGKAEVDELWARLRAGSAAQPDRAASAASAVQRQSTWAVLHVAQPQPLPDAASWPSVDAFVECAARGSTALADASPALRRAELERLHALVQARAAAAACCGCAAQAACVTV